MSSEQSSVRQMFEYPNDSHEHKNRKYLLKGHRNKRNNNDSNKTQNQTFYKVVQKAKNVALFTQNLKQRIAENHSLNMHTLKSNELQYLENDSQIETKLAYFSHQNKLVVGFQMLFIGIMLIYLWQCTFEIVFGAMDTNQIINILALIIYLIHILFYQVTQYKNQRSQLIVDLNEIREVYMKQRFIKDLISVIVFTLQLTSLDSYQERPVLFIVIRILSLVSYVELSSSCQKVENLVSSSIQGQTIISFLKLLFKLLLFLHCLSISLNLLVTIQNYFNIHKTWLSSPTLEYSTNLQKYVLGWYWGATILSTVGFGDVIPANNVQRFFVSLIQVCCCMTFGYFVNAIGQMIKMRSQSSEKYEKQLRSLNRFLNFLTLSNELKHKIRTHYFNKHLVESMHDPKQQKQVFQTITPNLKTSLLQQINLKIIKRCPQLQKFKSDTINHIAQSLKRIILAPQYILYSRNTSQKKLWFIESGNLEEFTDNFQNSKLRKIVSVYNEKDPLVGWINFVTPNSYKTLVKAKNFAVAHELDQNQFKTCLLTDIREYHKFLQIKQLMIEKRKKFNSKCVSCDRYTHNVMNCPRIHFIKKEGSKIVQKILLDRFIEQQNCKKKINRPEITYNWKYLFGSGRLQKEAKILINSQTSKMEGGTIETFLKNLAFRQSVIGFEKRKASFLITPTRNQNQIRDTTKIIENNQRSRTSYDVEEEDKPVEFQKVFFNKQNEDYLPQHDIENVLSDYHKRFLKKKMNQQYKKVIPSVPTFH